eukprot:CAMPEP_0174311070 /NCGR_PEP_ID=MMETSP0810-20121108/3480_1 /TAXON_ID=73025 ORGANISM="Eutreptiella gymnastica-like, Strain CCMP1594" /NCGR_SAMPLE_ID=MMETSP0810 /ASSEMBLY_ACC=CAM_ASM_000659 /LENGTH=64 /DNA_ID=CAMNT_0015419211 /DNA_START=1445 /DNA_END=1640 /DNA_ORIENTATION=-
MPIQKSPEGTSPGATFLACGLLKGVADCTALSTGLCWHAGDAIPGPDVEQNVAAIGGPHKVRSM